MTLVGDHPANGRNADGHRCLPMPGVRWGERDGIPLLPKVRAVSAPPTVPEWITE